MFYTFKKFKLHKRGLLVVLLCCWGIVTFSQTGSPVSGRELVQPDPDGTFSLTSETGEGMGPAIKYMPDWRAYGWFTSEDWVEWKVNVTYEGVYEVYMEWSVSDEEAGKEFVLDLESDSLIGRVEKSGSWETYKLISIGKVQLGKGIQDVIFRPSNKFEGEALLDLRFLRFLPVR